MINRKEVYDFAIKWYDHFEYEINHYKEIEYMGEECEKLGFIIDEEEAFAKLYGRDEYNVDMIEDIEDIFLLGSIIYSRWYYFDFWMYDDLYRDNNCQWFMIALNRLKELSLDCSYQFKGILKRIHLRSINLHPYIVKPQESIQDLTIDSEGNMTLLGYKDNELIRTKTIKLEQSMTQSLFHIISSYFQDNPFPCYQQEANHWLLELTNDKQDIYEYRESLNSYLQYEGKNLSHILRQYLQIDDLYAFDGECLYDEINKITIDYNRISKNEIDYIEEKQAYDITTSNYHEQIIIDRKTNTIEYIHKLDSGCRIFHKYEIEEEIEDFLDEIDVTTFFIDQYEDNEDIIKSNDSRDYIINIEYEYNPPRLIKGNFYKKGLPKDYQKFAKRLSSYLQFYNKKEALNPYFYLYENKPLYTYLSVVFDDYEKSYYYISNLDDIEIGDFVIVPAGKDNREEIVEVVDIEYYDEDNAPYPTEKTKRVIRKYEYY